MLLILWGWNVVTDDGLLLEVTGRSADLVSFQGPRVLFIKTE